MPPIRTTINRQELINAINLLMMRGQLHPETSYDFVKARRIPGGGGWEILPKEKGHLGRLKVRIWVTDLRTGQPIGQVGLIDPVDLLAGAGPLPLIQGKSDYV